MCEAIIKSDFTLDLGKGLGYGLGDFVPFLGTQNHKTELLPDKY